MYLKAETEIIQVHSIYIFKSMHMYSKMAPKSEYLSNLHHPLHNGKLIKSHNFVVFLPNAGEIGVQYVYLIKVLAEVKSYIIFYTNHYPKPVILKSYYLLPIYTCSTDFCSKMEIFVVNKKNSGVTQKDKAYANKKKTFAFVLAYCWDGFSLLILD